MFGLEPCTHFYSTIAEDFSLGPSIKYVSTWGEEGSKTWGKMIDWHRKVLTMGKGDVKNSGKSADVIYGRPLFILQRECHIPWT